MTACSSSFTEVVAMTLFNDVTTKIEPHSFQECRSDCQPATGKTSLGSFCPQRAMNTGPKALGVHGVPWQTSNYKSYEESLELKLHSVSKQTNKKKSTKPLQWCWDPRCHFSQPRDTLHALLHRGLCRLMAAALQQHRAPPKCLCPSSTPITATSVMPRCPVTHTPVPR